MRTSVATSLVTLVLVAGCASDEPKNQGQSSGATAPPRADGTRRPATADPENETGAIVIKGSKHADSPDSAPEATDQDRIARLEAQARASEGQDHGKPYRAPAKAAAPGSTVAPDLPTPYVGFNSFTLTGVDQRGKPVAQRFDAGQSFGLLVSGAPWPMVMTAYHVFGPDGGVPNQIPPNQLPSTVRSLDIESGDVVATCGAPLVIAGARPLNIAGGHADASGDMAAFQLTDGRLATLQLAAKDPARNDPVWLACRRADETGAARLHAGVVVALDKGALVVGLRENGDMRGTSGAPIVNASGEVVGIFLGTTNLSDGRSVAIAAPRSAIADQIQAAVAAGH
jgi:hypothetical protein